MPIEITMPRLSDTMEKGTIVKWHVAAGDAIASGDVLADVETDKATMEMQSYDDGTMATIMIGEGQPVEIGTVVAVMTEEDESLDDVAISPPAPADSAAAAPAHSDSQPEPAKAEVVEPAASAVTRHGNLRVSPVARRLADEHGVDLKTLTGSGTLGRIVKRDVLSAVGITRETAAAVPPSATPMAQVPAVPVVSATPVEAQAAPMPVKASEMPAVEGYGLQAWSEPLSGMRQTIARRLVESKTTVPHYQVSMAFNMDPMVELRAQLNTQLAPHNVKLSINDLLVRCCALAMYTNPLMNASWGGDCINYHSNVNVGIAVSLPPERGGGLVVATIRNADQKSLRMINAESHALAKKARTKGLTVDEMGDSTFTVSN
ncbi:MAG: dihydrolipoamide acetyltransferase family protein, partial [Phycisphaerales bacterium]|nr:dihydrolipoamide acetyltransferase family protein [Phycisphaerales bacterium]